MRGGLVINKVIMKDSSNDHEESKYSNLNEKTNDDNLLAE